MLLSGRNTKGESCISPLFSVASITGCATIPMLRRASGACNGAAGDLFAGVVQLQNVSFPSSTRGFDSPHPLQSAPRLDTLYSIAPKTGGDENKMRISA